MMDKLKLVSRCSSLYTVKFYEMCYTLFIIYPWVEWAILEKKYQSQQLHDESIRIHLPFKRKGNKKQNCLLKKETTKCLPKFLSFFGEKKCLLNRQTISGDILLSPFLQDILFFVSFFSWQKKAEKRGSLKAKRACAQKLDFCKGDKILDVPDTVSLILNYIICVIKRRYVFQYYDTTLFYN